MMIADRQNREKSMHRRRKKEQIIQVANNQDDDDADGDGDGDEVDEDETDMEKSTMNVAMVETNEALTVNMKMCISAYNAHRRRSNIPCSNILLIHISLVQREKEKTNQLTSKLSEMESRLVRGGRNILDTYNERQIELEKKLEEIADRKKREVEMQQQLELQEETTIEIRETLTSVQQEVEVKTRKLKKCYNKYQVYCPPPIP